jgi:uncharacterized protein
MPPDPTETTSAEPLISELPPVQPAEQPPAPPAREPFWGYQDLLLIVGFAFLGILAIFLVASAAAAFSPALRKDPTPLELPLQFVFYFAIYLGFVTVFRLRYNRPALESLGWRRSNFNPLLAAVVGVVMAIALSALGQLLRTPENDLIDKLVNSWSSFILFALTAAVVAPLFEELLFRGFLQPLLSRTFGLVAGVLITAALFGSLHLFQYSLAWQYALIIFLAGAVFGWVRARTGSVIPSTIMHCCFNSVSVIAYLISSHPKFK